MPPNAVLLSRVHSKRIELNCSARTAAVQLVNFVTLTRVTNNASCNWVNLVPVSSVHLVCCEHGFTISAWLSVVTIRYDATWDIYVQ